MYRKTLWILCLFLAGCVAMTSAPEFSSYKWERPVIALTNIEKVQLGMTYNEVAEIMEETVSVGYKASAGLEGAYEEVLVQNPYNEEILEGYYAQYRVVYYLTHIKRADGAVADDELTPLIFEENRLIGKGRSFLFELKDRSK